jgi:hypothetical protein
VNLKEHISIIAAVVAGVFAIIAAFISWKLKSSTEERERSIARAKEKHDELKHLYAEVFVLFEQAIKKVKHREDFTLDAELSHVNAKLQLLASEPVINAYHQAGELLQEWSRLHYKTFPPTMKFGEQTLTLIQAPDPTEHSSRNQRTTLTRPCKLFSSGL